MIQFRFQVQVCLVVCLCVTYKSLVSLTKALMNDSITTSSVSRCVALVSLTKVPMNISSVSRCVCLV